MAEDIVNGLEAHIQSQGETLNNLRTPIAIIAPDGTIKFANEQALNDFGGVPVDLVGKKVTDILIDPSTNNARSLLLKTREASEKFRAGFPSQSVELPEVTIITKNGRQKIIQFKPNFLKKAGKILGFELEINDITRQKQEIGLLKAVKLINSTLELEDVLGNMRDILFSVLPHASANIMLFENDELRVKHKWGYDEKDTVNFVHNQIVDMESRPLLKQMQNSHQPAFVADTNLDPRYIQPALESPDTKKSKNQSWIGAPLIVKNANGDEKIIGFINLNDTHSLFYNETDSILLKSFADHLALALNNAKNKELLQGIVDTDKITGLKSLDFYERAFRSEVERAVRENLDLALVLPDIDKFSNINDFCGHDEGDNVLRKIGDVINKNIRHYDIGAKLHGEELAILFVNLRRGRAAVIAEKIRSKIANLPPSTATIKSHSKHGDIITIGQNLPLNASMGVADLNEVRDFELEREVIEQSRTTDHSAYDRLISNYMAKLYTLADQRLYDAKNSGRGKVVFDDSIRDPSEPPHLHEPS